jgi:hypothetical protein
MFLQSFPSLGDPHVRVCNVNVTPDKRVHTLMNPRGDMQYFFQVERMVLEHQLQAALKRTSALRTRAAKQKDFSCAEQATQLERILLHSQRRINEL